MTKELNSKFKASSFCCVLNNIDKLFDLKDTTFNDPKYSDETRKQVEAFRANLDPNKTYSPEEMVEHLIYLWVDGKEETRSAAANYEIGENGVHHSHLILEAKNQTRFSAIKKLYPAIHIELTRGTRDDVTAYLNKTGKHAEKAHTTVVPMMNHGIIEADQQGKRTDLETIQELLEAGLTPEQIMRQNLSYRRFSKMIKEHYYQMKVENAPLVKEMSVYWHQGPPGGGKSFQQIQLKKEFGHDSVYVLSDYGTGGMDNYTGEPILFMDEFKGDVDYQTFLKLLDVYPNQVHARYTNIYALWSEVHISSIFTPREIYNLLVPKEQQKHDPIEQLYRRIHTVVYHTKTSDNQYKTLKMTMTDYLELVRRKLDFETLITDYITEDDTTSDYTYDPNKKATTDTSTDQSETDSDSSTKQQ
ncbi:TPA: replication protein RepA [Streptococcus equi subsp. zooepidemicus]|nr:replication protein RepA [Streptococcus equi subsp. zooepidemicus]HEL0429288.1 replication protein RepA [Streptococcus equi subsp. zooepidemicus]HEL0431423.1 replication protein RepA [Streptococcus equi subsp. zooepidemicus]HEL0435548.1 replication protein RepA [Streptococcus equi subsp. zooepidemicus]HEL0439660.1 replication protein RepA [Streptococcus equi subsp. zooepidemicus]